MRSSKRTHSLLLYLMCVSFRGVDRLSFLTRVQTNKANFDISHELDEFLMVEKPLTATKRKAHPDWEKMKPELRQLEEQCVLHIQLVTFV